MPRAKTAACKFIEAKTMVVPSPGKFPDVENKPVKSNTAGTDNIEDQKYQKDAGTGPPIGKQGSANDLLYQAIKQAEIVNVNELPGLDKLPQNPNLRTLQPYSPPGDGSAANVANRATGYQPQDPVLSADMTAGLGPDAQPGPDGIMGTPDDFSAPSEDPVLSADMKAGLGVNARTGPDGVMGTPDDGHGTTLGEDREYQRAQAYNPRDRKIQTTGRATGPVSAPMPSPLLGGLPSIIWQGEEHGRRREREATLEKNNSANDLMQQAIKQAIWPFKKKKEKEEKPAGPQVGDIYTGGVLLESEEDVDAHLQPMMQADTLKFQQENPGASFEDFMASPVGQDWIKPRDELSAEDQLIARGEKQAHGDGSFGGGQQPGGGGDGTQPGPPWGNQPGGGGGGDNRPGGGGWNPQPYRQPFDFNDPKWKGKFKDMQPQKPFKDPRLTPPGGGGMQEDWNRREREQTRPPIDFNDPKFKNLFNPKQQASPAASQERGIGQNWGAQ